MTMFALAHLAQLPVIAQDRIPYVPLHMVRLVPFMGSAERFVRLDMHPGPTGEARVL